MAQNKSKEGSSGKKANADKPEETGHNAADAIPEALRDAGRRAADLAQNPVARSLLAAGLVTAAAALAANKNVRDTTIRNVKEAQDATEAALEAATENANKIGAAIINAATDAVQKMMSMSAGMMGAAAGASSADASSESGQQSAPQSEQPQPQQAQQPQPEPVEAQAPAPAAPRPPRTPRAKAGEGASAGTKPAAQAPSVQPDGHEAAVHSSTKSRTPKPKGASGGKKPAGKKAGSGHARKANNAKQGPLGGS